MTQSVVGSPCHCMVIRQGARRLTQIYDRHLAPTGLKTSQFGLLRRLSRVGPLSIATFAEHMGMDRTTMGRALRPLERDGLVEIAAGADGRTRAIAITQGGRSRIEAALPFWQAAQDEFEAAFGADDAEALRTTLVRLAARCLV